MFWFDIIPTQRCWYCKLHKRHIWRQDIVVPYVTTYASRYVMRTKTYTFSKKRTGVYDMHPQTRTK